MKYQLKYIKNPANADNLISLYESDLYSQIIAEFETQTHAKLNDKYDKQSIRQSIAKKYLIVNIPFDVVQEELKANKTEFIDFCVKRHKFYNNYTDENPDGEFADGEELDDDDKSVVIKEHGIAKSFLLDNFCEFYLLKLGDTERVFHFLKTTKMPYAKKHLSEITKIYKSKKNI